MRGIVASYGVSSVMSQASGGGGVALIMAWRHQLMLWLSLKQMA